MASVAMDLLESVMRFSRSKLQAVTAAGWVIATYIENNNTILLNKPLKTVYIMAKGK
jgi:hypothetical protein